jgi:hypothetical protein
MARAQIIERLDNLDMEVVMDTFVNGEWNDDFEFVQVLAGEGPQGEGPMVGNFRGGHHGANVAQFRVTIHRDVCQLRMTRNGGGRDDGTEAQHQAFNDNFFNCVEQAREWVNEVIRVIRVVEDFA